jgi:periplasmic divalent cation tolerance protein
MDNHIIIYITFPDKKAASIVVEQLLNHKYIACANLIDNVRSHFWWQGTIDETSEVMAIVKTTRAMFEKVVALVQRDHPYEVPEIIAVPIIAGSESYLKWIDEAVESGQ